MSLWFDVLVILLCVVGNAVYSGSETALYTVSRVRVEVEARRGTRARLMQRFLHNDSSFVIVTVLGVNLCVEILAGRAQSLSEHIGLPAAWGEVILALGITPFVFFFGDLLPKDLFRRRPYAFLRAAAPMLELSRWLFWPLERVLWLISHGAARLTGGGERLLSVVRGREAVLDLLRESTKTGAILPHAELLARNVLKLRSIEVERAMVPWARVRYVSEAKSEAERFAMVAESPLTRLIVVDRDGKVAGYVHQLDVLGAGPDVPVLEHLRPVIELSAHTPVDRALARLRSGGQRLAIVGTRERPLGLVTLKDLVEEISGDLAGW